MQLSYRQYQTLAELDIPVWQRRTVVSEPTVGVAEETEPTSTFDLSPAVWLVSSSTTLNDDETRLLKAMLKAIGLSRQSTALLGYEQIKVVADVDIANKTILLLGEMSDIMPANAMITKPEMLMHSGGSSRWIMTYSLKEMLQNTKLKATVWQALKLFKSSLLS